MKQALGIMLVAALAFSAGVARAAGYDQEIMTATASTSVTGTTASCTIVGEVNDIIVTVPSGKTCTVAVASADGLTLFSKAACVGTTVYRPRFDIHSYAGAILGSGTEAVSLTEAVYLTGSSTNAAHAITGTVGFAAGGGGGLALRRLAGAPEPAPAQPIPATGGAAPR
jgi:hypothetical protein